MGSTAAQCEKSRLKPFVAPEEAAGHQFKKNKNKNPPGISLSSYVASWVMQASGFKKEEECGQDDSTASADQLQSQILR